MWPTGNESTVKSKLKEVTDALWDPEVDHRGDVYVAPREHDDGETMWIMEGLELYAGLSITETSPSQRAMDAQGRPKNATIIKGGRSTNGIVCRVGETITSPLSSTAPRSRARLLARIGSATQRRTTRSPTSRSS